ncbi:hypothetical protein BLNAU_9191 [Blattamonas nauphoetae]|uniref:Clp1 P-loop domain-containing protein n=1 Tax=Blattamonas nauphoetae TaxID=2049346 RepID=A0ABQ9XWI6_9EUKA|nr:hypothetical protein BLNAU_9191 [Blattamonas nauphoetae]
MSDDLYSAPTASEQVPLTAQSKSQSIPAYTPAEEKAAAQGCMASTKTCYTSKPMKIIVITLVIVICFTLIGVIGVLNPFILVSKQIFHLHVANFLFALYTALGALLLLLLECKLTIIFRFVPFLMSPTYRSIFLIFLGTLSMASYDGIKGQAFIGYMIGIFAVVIGLMQLILCCCDRKWKRQVQKDYQSLARQSITNYNSYPPHHSINDDQPVQSSNKPITGSTGDIIDATLSSQENRSFDSTTAQVAVKSTVSTENADYTASDVEFTPQLQSLAVDSAISAVQNPAVQHAVKQAGSSAFNLAMSDAYDRLPVKDHGPHSKTLMTRRPPTIPSVDSTVWEISQTFQALQEEAKTHNTQGPVLVIIGPTDSGKSTLAHQILQSSSTLQRYPLFVDLDPGQNSISPPGTISVSQVEFTGHEPSYKNQLVFFLGSVSSDSLQMKHLMRQLNKAIESSFLTPSSPIEKHFGIVINTSGYVEGNGQPLQFATIGIFRPNMIVLLDMEDKQANYERFIMSQLSKINVSPSFHGGPNVRRFSSDLHLYTVRKHDQVVVRSRQFRSNARQQSINRFFAKSHRVSVIFADLVFIAPIPPTPHLSQYSINYYRQLKALTDLSPFIHKLAAFVVFPTTTNQTRPLPIFDIPEQVVDKADVYACTLASLQPVVTLAYLTAIPGGDRGKVEICMVTPFIPSRTLVLSSIPVPPSAH